MHRNALRGNALLRTACLASSAVALANAVASAGTYKTINVDGVFDDWANVPVLASDPAEGGPIDFGTVQIANDADNLYLRITYQTPVNPNAAGSGNSNLAFDTDNNLGTGYNIYGLGLVGSEVAFSNDYPFQQTSDNFNTGVGLTSNGVAVGAAIAPFDFMNQFNAFSSQEYRIPRNVAYSNNGAAVFGSSFKMIFWSENGAADVTDAISYTFAALTTGWSLGGSGDYNVASNWSSNAVPNAVDAIAELGTSITKAETIYSNSAVTVGTLTFNNANTYVLAGAGSLTLQSSADAAVVNVLAGSQKINLPLIVASKLTINAAAGTTLKISDPVTVNAGKSITQTGTGTVTYESTINVLTGGAIAFGSSTHAAALTLANTATASITDGATRSVLNLDALTIGTGAKLNINKNELLATMTPNDARLAIVAGKLFSSSSTAAAGLGYSASTGGKTRVLFTKIGDATLDRTVNFDDLVPLAQNYNKSGKLWSDGDFTYDGVVNFDDLVPLAQSYNTTLAGLTLPSGISAEFASDWALAQALVPEPTSIAAIALGALALGRRAKPRIA